jgi:hypothetical protein
VRHVYYVKAETGALLCHRDEDSLVSHELPGSIELRAGQALSPRDGFQVAAGSFDTLTLPLLPPTASESRERERRVIYVTSWWYESFARMRSTCKVRLDIFTLVRVEGDHQGQRRTTSRGHDSPNQPYRSPEPVSYGMMTQAVDVPDFPVKRLSLIG